MLNLNINNIKTFSFGTFLQSLIAQGHYASSEIQTRLVGLREEHARLHKVWQQRQDLFSQCYELQVFMRDAEQRDAWISTQEAFLANEDLGVSILSHVAITYTYSVCRILCQ